MEKKVFRFDVEKLDVFKVSVEFVRYARSREAWFKGDADRKQQLWRAADSIALNIAEGAGRIAGREKLSFYRVALGSADRKRWLRSSMGSSRSRPPSLSQSPRTNAAWKTMVLLSMSAGALFPVSSHC